MSVDISTRTKLFGTPIAIIVGAMIYTLIGIALVFLAHLLWEAGILTGYLLAGTNIFLEAWGYSVPVLIAVAIWAC